MSDEPTRTVVQDALALTSEYDDATSSLPKARPARKAPMPEFVGRFQVIEELARGGMGVVYRASEPAIGREVAVKLLREKLRGEPAAVRRFLDEARITGQLQHPAIPPVFEVGELAGGSPFLAMKLIKGSTLDRQLRDRPNLAADRGRFLAVFEHVCQAVAYAHAHGVIHRDLKPNNVMVGAFGEVQVMDWGLAKTLVPGANSAQEPAGTTTEIRTARDSDGSFTQAGSVLGTPSFMPPEQAGGEIDLVDRRADVFGLGAVLCVILTGEPPYLGVNAEEVRLKAIRGQLDDARQRLDACGADPDWIALCKQCLTADPAERPVDARAVAESVSELRVAAEERARAAELERATAHERRKRRRILGTAIGLVAGLLAIGAWWNESTKASRATELARRQAETEADGGSALIEAHANLDRAERSLDDLTRWEADLTATDAAIRRAEQAAKAGEPTEDLRERVAAARGRWAKSSALLKLATRLDEAIIRVDFGTQPGAASESYRKSFADAGFEVLDGDATPVGSAIRNNPLAALLRAALFDWYAVGNEPQQKQIRAVLEVASGPDEKLPLPGDATRKTELIRLAADPATLDWPPRRIEALVLALGAERPRGNGIRLDVYRPEVLDSRAETMPRDELAERADALLMSAVDRYPTDVRLRFAAAFTDWNRMTRTRAELAGRHLVAAVALRPSSPKLWTMQGIAMIRLGDLPAAIRSFERALALNPRMAEAHNGLGNVYMVYLPDLNRAAAYFKAANDIQPHALFACNLGRTLGTLNDHAGSLAAYREAIKLDPTYSRAYVDISGEHIIYGEFSEALEPAKKAVELEPDHALAHYNLGLALGGKGRLGESLREINKAIALDPTFKKPIGKKK